MNISTILTGTILACGLSGCYVVDPADPVYPTVYRRVANDGACGWGRDYYRQAAYDCSTPALVDSPCSSCTRRAYIVQNSCDDCDD